MLYRNLFLFILGPIILGVILANLTWFWVSIRVPWAVERGIPFPFYSKTIECVLPVGAEKCPGEDFIWEGYVLDLFFWVIIILIIVQSIKFFAKLR